MARSIVSSPVDPIKDYGETIVACAARSATLLHSHPRPRRRDSTPATGYIRDGFYVNGETFDPARRDAETPKSTPANAVCRWNERSPSLPPSLPPGDSPRDFMGIFSRSAHCISRSERARSPNNEYSVNGERSRELTPIDLGILDVKDVTLGAV